MRPFRTGIRGERAYLAGWDSALTHPCGGAINPYKRADYRRRWEQGRKDCMAGNDLPEWAKGKL